VTQELVWLVANDMNFDEAHRKYLRERFPYIEYSIIYNIKIAEIILIFSLL